MELRAIPSAAGGIFFEGPLYAGILKRHYLGGSVLSIRLRDAGVKGLRHGFAVAALEKGIPLNLLQKWLGHANLATTAIYGNAVGAEERKMAKRMWS